jgi:diguanylate cyclase (GGDEF)-like protein/PAS domain S-box-containing protein
MRTASARETILVVDDEPQVLVALDDLLSDEFLVLKSNSGEAALHLVEQEPDIAVVLSDQRMPKMQGDELFRKLRANFEAERILATGFADLSAVIRAVNDGQIFAYVTKPWDPEDLRSTIQRAAEHFRLVRERAQDRRLLDDLMNNLPDAIYFKDAELKFQRVNHSMAALAGTTGVEGIVGRKLSELWPGSQAALEAEEAERTLLRERTQYRDHLASFTVAGERRWFSTSKAPICNRAGVPVGLVGVARDVTDRVRIEDALKTREEQLRLTFLASNASLFDWHLLNGTVENSSNVAPPIAGDTAGKLSREEFESRIHPEDLAWVRTALELHFGERAPLRGVELRLLLEGEYRWFELSAQAVWNEAGKAERLVGSTIDITERKQQEARIRRLTRTYAVLSGINSTILRVHERAALLSESCNIAVRVGELALAMVVGPRRRGSERALASDGASPEVVSRIADWLVDDHSPSGFVARLSSARSPVVINDLQSDNALGVTGDIVRADGHRALAVLPVLVSNKVDCLLVLFATQAFFFDEDQVKLLAELADNIGFALGHRELSQRLDFLASYDDLTGLSNRRLLHDRLAHQLAVCSQEQLKLAVVLVDIERFRQINETLGRQAGDAVLVEIARRLQLTTEVNWVISRYASNTFAIIVGPLETESSLIAWVDRALATLGESATVAGTELRLSARIGIAMFPADGPDADALLANAEAALKNGKARAQRYRFYTPAMNERVAERLRLETRLRNAIEQHQFLLHYQPKVELKTGKVVGLEALIRWLGSDGKLIAPGLFIPLLEETGMIVEVGKWVMDSAAKQHADWSARGLNPPRIAVNVSPLQLAQPDFLHTIAAVLSKFPLANSGLDLEITESVLMEDLHGNTDKLRQAREAGLGVAIDDFGTGYSSLGYISRLPIDALKIDRSFVMRMADEPQEVSIVTTIISLAHALDLKVIAEGVENAQQAQLLRLLKCDQVQGYFFARPQAAEAAETLLATSFSLTRATT